MSFSPGERPRTGLLDAAERFPHNRCASVASLREPYALGPEYCSRSLRNQRWPSADSIEAHVPVPSISPAEPRDCPVLGPSLSSIDVIDGVSPLSIPASASIEGMHQIVSEGTKLCLNINQNSTRSGEAILPYPCSGFSNMEFNFVDQRNGFYSIHTVNGTKGLCLNVSNATASPGDGKKYGGPGNLIQWDCGDGSLPDNELFKIVDLGSDRIQILVKSSGLCLEDPGRGGTIRQNRCNQSNLSQVFILTE
ncbi:MAG TPA: RICIN domain-containing protein [Candidatus Acidoferrum sp.]|nr:RICIN domain-containing protein [Candidatus Acidoferrum sp.]